VRNRACKSKEWIIPKVTSLTRTIIEVTDVVYRKRKKVGEEGMLDR
jgi:hypothetical protein